MKIAHILNPIKVDKKRDLYFQQPIVRESILNAKRFAENVPDLEIKLVQAGYIEDQDVIDSPEWLKTPLLEESILDHGTFKIDRKLPLFKDIIGRLVEAVPDADYYVQTNTDIGLMPYFYTLVKDLIDDGEDSFCINKRVVPETLKDAPLGVLYSAVGTKHAGHDCIVFPATIADKLDLGMVCTGAPWCENTLVVNMVRYADKFSVFKEIHATFGIGDRRGWIIHDLNDYRVNNTNEFARILRKLKHKQVMKHEVIKYYLHKLLMEVRGYAKETYSEDCHYFLEGK
jgi:hypothetical protein